MAGRERGPVFAEGGGPSRKSAFRGQLRAPASDFGGKPLDISALLHARAAGAAQAFRRGVILDQFANSRRQLRAVARTNEKDVLAIVELLAGPETLGFSQHHGATA